MSTDRTPKPIPHGTQNGYGNLGCRCEACRYAHKLWFREYMVRRRERSPRPIKVSTMGLPLTPEMLRERFTYNTETGRFTAATGRRTGSRRQSGYRSITIDGKTYLEHRLAWLYVHGRWPVEQIDHINGITDDNRLCNLREATSAQNSQNHHRAHRNNKSGYAGVSWNTKNKKWQARITIDGKEKYLGLFLTPSEAHVAYRAAKEASHPFWSGISGAA